MTSSVVLSITAKECPADMVYTECTKSCTKHCWTHGNVCLLCYILFSMKILSAYAFSPIDNHLQVAANSPPWE